MEQYDFDPSDSKDALLPPPRSYHESLEIPQLLREMPNLIHNLSSYDAAKPSYHGDENSGPRTRARTLDDVHPQYLAQPCVPPYKPEKNKKCQVCGKHARTPSDLLRHMRVHTGERPFLCVACDKTFKCKRSQLTHQYLSHGIKDGLSDHRLDVLDHRKVKRNTTSSNKLLKSNNFCNQVPTIIDKIMHDSYIKQQLELHTSPQQQPTVVVDQDEDTEIMAGEEISSMSDGPVNFVGLFNPPSAADPCPPAVVKEEGEDLQQEGQQPDKSEPQQQEVGDNNNSVIIKSNFNKSNKKKKKDHLGRKVPILRIKTHKCTHCKRQFRSVYTLRYHLRSMHDEKVYLSPALESRLKKRRWIPPHVRLQKSKISSCSSKKKSSFPFLQQKEQKFKDNNDKEDLQHNCDFSLEIKKEKNDGYEDDINNNVAASEKSRSMRDLLGLTENDAKQLSFFNSNNALPNNSANSTTAFNLNNSGSANPFVLPPHIFFPSTPAAEEGLMNEKPISWESLQATSESVLISKLEAVHPGTQQKYVLYKCGPCGKAFASLRTICGHLALNHDTSKERDCEKCGASFNWRQDLDTHLECHQATDRKFVPPPSSPFLPSYYVNPFPIPVVTPSEQLPATRLLPYPFFPMPQQLPQLMQPGFFPFFAAAALQPQMQQQQPNNNEEAARRTPENVPSSTPAMTATAVNPEDDKNQSFTFKCKLCPKTFDRIFSLQRHERIHSGVKACFCKICGRGFSELRNLRHHIIRFHAESAQKEPLPYRRRPNRMRNVSSSQKLVSFLKKTAVRILNSMGGSKSADDAKPAAPKAPSEEELASSGETASATEAAEQSAAMMPKLFDATSQAPPPSNAAEEEVPPPKLSPSPPEDAKAGKNKGAVEVLQDPKRSLLGNRRKGRPFKLNTMSSQAVNLSEDLLFPLADANFLEKHAEAISESSLLQATEILNGCLKPEIAFPQLSYFNIDTSTNNEPIDMRSKAKDVKKEVEEPPPPLPAFPSSENNLGLNLYNDPAQNSSSLKLPESFESRCLFPCSYCHKSFNSITDINRHMSFHADIRPFKCPYCSYCSRTNSQLKVHMMRHEGIKHYMCQICNYNGVTQSDLNRHLKTRTHLLRSRNVCSCCGTGFHTRSLSDEHYKSCHMGANGNNVAEPSKPAATASSKEPSSKSSSNRNRVTRLKQFRQTPEEKAKSEFYQKLCDLNSMGLALGDFLQQNALAAGLTEK